VRHKTDILILSKERHAPPYGAASELIKHMRRHKLAPECLGNQAWHVEFNDMISVMISHSPHLAVQLKWALGIVFALEAELPGGKINYVAELTWERFVRNNNDLHGSLNHRPQFHDTDRIIKILIKEWVRPKRDGEGTDPI
jgi:hypothetical protein